MKLQLMLALAGGPDAYADRRTRRRSDQTALRNLLVQCHGLNRNGTGVNLPGLSVRPRDHTDAKGMGATPDDELFKAIKEGGLAVNKSVLMPTWGGVLTDQQITELVKYLREVCHCGS